VRCNVGESKQQEWFIAERARALALVHLTRRDDVTVTPAGREVGLDLMVYLKKDRSVRPFGVFLRGSRTNPDRLNETLRPAMRELGRGREFPYPVVLFHFAMEEDRGHYTWVAEPEVTETGPRLIVHEEPHCAALDRAALDGIVGRVDGWYDAFFGRIGVKAS
jgi:hypothetical protein